MISKVQYLQTQSTDPFYNLAVEEYLTRHVEKDALILYLWQNRKTVVIGKNQNPWKECRIRELEKEGGQLVRRLSGGGAVFHDLGNLNFTFIASKENYSVSRQMQVILEAVRAFGIPAELSGRNDLTVQGRKFSGNAFYSNGVNAYHHGTLLVDADLEKLSRYLHVDPEKLSSKGVDSVRSRVVNLSEFCPEITIGKLKYSLIDVLGKIYGFFPFSIENHQLNPEEISKIREKFFSWEWRFGKRMEFQYTISRRFAWGMVELCLTMDEGKIRQARFYSDAMEWKIWEEAAAALAGCAFSAQSIGERVAQLAEIQPEAEIQAILRDVGEWLFSQEI